MTTLVKDPPVLRGPAHVPEAEPDPDRGRVERLRLVLIELVLVFAVFAQSAGNAVADTKIDLVVSPWRFLHRAMSLWDPIGGSGQLQNQAYGYLFPIGPFYGVLNTVGFEPWEVQRAFEAAIVGAAFLGCYRLARAFGIDAFWPAVAAGLAYALAPRVLAELSSISAELLPTAALPWVLLPLVRAADTGSVRRAAAASGVALLFASGVNAAATVAILPVPALWLLTRRRGPRRRALMGWWTLAVALSCAWWVIPLLQLGRFSPPFLDWIETSSITTSPTNLLASLRGLDHWEAYLGPGVWPGGWILASAGGTIVATTLVAAGGLLGLSLRGVRHRTFLWLCLLLGLVLVTAGHAATVGPPGAGVVRDLLDGPLVPFRNIHKFDPVVRLPLALGLGLLMHRVGLPAQLGLRRRRREKPVATLPIRLLAALAVVAVGAVAITPIWTNRIVSSQRITTEPSWWARAGTWLHQHGHGTRALVVPSTGAPHYLWGGTVDNAMQPVALSPWAVRDGVPLGQPGYIRLLDAIDDQLASGAAVPSLAPLLARAGIGFVVVSNDLDVQASGSTPLVYVRATLENSPGFTPRAAFGPGIGGSLRSDVVIDGGGTVSRPAVQIYGVVPAAQRAGLYPARDAVAATGSSDALPGLLDRGLTPRQAVLFGPDARGIDAGHRVTTDGIRKREASFSGVSVMSVTMAAGQSYLQPRKVHDYLPPGATLSAYRYRGIAGVTASSSGADNWAFVNRSPLNGPWSALDPDTSSAWQSTGIGAVGQWLQVDLGRQVRTRTVRLSFGLPDDSPAPLPTRVTVTTDAGSRTDRVFPLTAPQDIAVPARAFRYLRITVASVTGDGLGTSVAIRSLRVPGVHPSRVLAVPAQRNPDVLAFDAPAGYRSPCLALRVGPVCDRIYGGRSQEDSGIDRSFDTSGPSAGYVVSGTVRLRPGTSLNRILDAHTRVRVTASSVGTLDPRRRPGAAYDGDPNTVWQAAAGDPRPVLTLRLPKPERLTGMTIVAPLRNTSVARPVRVRVVAGKQRFVGTIPSDGRVVFRHPVTTDRVSITVLFAVLRTTATSVSLRQQLVAAGIADVHLDGIPDTTSSDPVLLPCGTLAVRVDGVRVPLSVSARLADVLAGAPVVARGCAAAPVPLAAGAHRATLDATPLAVPSSLTLARADRPLASTSGDAGDVRITSWGNTRRTAQVRSPDASLFVVHENFNPGWTATLGGHQLRAVQVDGWQQAFLVPAGSTGVLTATFAPQQGFALGLGVGLLGVLVLLALALVRGRGRRPDPAAAGPGAMPSWLAYAGAALAAAALGGVPGLVVAAGIGLAGALLGSRVRPLLGWGGAALLVIAALVTTHGSGYGLLDRQNSATVQLLCIGALVAGVLAAVSTERRERVPAVRRSTGRSTRNQDADAMTTVMPTVRLSRIRKWPPKIG